VKIVTGTQMVELDRRTIQERGISEKSLIHRAGKAAAEWFQKHFESEKPILILAGKGNNGADGVVMGRELRRLGFASKTIRADEPDWSLRALHELKTSKKLENGGKLVVVDALFGTGLSRPVEGTYREAIEAMNASGFTLVSLDVPSGLDANNGQPLGCAVRADFTLTFELPKFGLVQEASADWVGELHLLTGIGFPRDLIETIKSPYDLIHPAELGLGGKRRRATHKGECGHVLIVGGSEGMAGAPALAARAALRSGAGLVSVFVPRDVMPTTAILAGGEIMTIPGDPSGAAFHAPDSHPAIERLLERGINAIVVGPGMGTHPDSGVFLQTLLSLAENRSIPVVLDADGLNLISASPSSFAFGGKRDRSMVVMTPHPGEMARLCRTTTTRVQKNRFGCAGKLADEWGVTVVLKGARTLISHPKRNPRFSVNALAGNPGMATPGCGDALSGIIGAHLAAGRSPADASRAAVWLHARAGDFSLSPKGGGTAGDLIEAIPAALVAEY
jgi:ADP-dependent NAD(P)H-hydrate dehydratase / NAD(P)H-hydrate epimerase